jgi:branched-chain amino acid transport system permease protein
MLMEEVLQQVINGLSIAGVIALIAIGITLIFGLTGIVMFAQGELLMFGGLITFSTMAAGGSFYLGLLFAVLAMGVLGLLLERGLFHFTLRAPMNGFIVSLGLIVALQHIAVEIWSGDQRIIAKPIETVWAVSDIRISATRVLVIAVTVALVVTIHFVMSRTRHGRALRATAADRDTAGLMGVPVPRYITATFVVGSMIAGLGGALLIALFPVSPFVGGTFVIKGFAVALIGGLGNVNGAVVAAVLLGLLEAMSAGFFLTEWVNAYAFGLMILVLMVRPQGIFRGSTGPSLG